jgi:DNA-binding beta-propeller fold protein YncE
MRSTKTGSAVTQMAGSQQGPYGLAVDDTGIYWTNSSNGTVMRLDK